MLNVLDPLMQTDMTGTLFVSSPNKDEQTLINGP